MPQQRKRGPQDRIPDPSGTGSHFEQAPDLDVQLPAGGKLTLQSPDEVVMWNEASKRYIADYRLTKANDLMQLGALLSHALLLYRAQKDLSDPDKTAIAQAVISRATDDIRKGEKALGIDKATREKGGQHTVGDYLTRLKRAAYEKGIHISERTKAYEALAMELRWKIRLLRNGDAEDKAYHGLTEKTIVDWLEGELARLEQKDKEWAKERGKIFVGRL